jgi:hypothetical protein
MEGYDYRRVWKILFNEGFTKKGVLRLKSAIFKMKGCLAGEKKRFKIS